MEDLSLEQLQAQFKAIQQRSSDYKISERNCVEIVQKMVEMGLLQVIYTVNGREYLTMQQLEREIADEIAAHNGRLNVLELQSILNVDSAYIDKKIHELLKKDKQSRLIDGEIMTRQYFTGVLAEINDILKEQSFIDLQILGKRFNLGTDFVRSLVAPRLGTIIDGEIEDDILYNSVYFRHQKQKIRGLITSLTHPTNLSQLIQKFKFQEGLFQKILDELEDEAALPGVITGSFMYTPRVFEESRTLWSVNFYKQNNYIEWKILDRFLIQNPKTFCESVLKDGICLSNAFIHESLFEQFQENVLHTLQNETWGDLLGPFPPSAITLKDIFGLLEKIKKVQLHGKNANCSVFEDHFLVSVALLNRCSQLYEQSLKEKIEKGLIKPLSLSSNLEASDSKSKKKTKEPQSETAISRKEESEIVKDLQHWIPDLPEDLAPLLLQHLLSSFTKIKEDLSRSLFLANVSDRKQKSESLEESFEKIFLNFQLFQKGNSFLTEEEAILDKYLLRTLGHELLRMLIMNQAVYLCIPIDNQPLNSPSDMNTLLAKFPSATASVLSKLVTCLTSGKGTGIFVTELENAASKLDLHLKILDKKTEKQFLLLQKQTLMNQLLAENNPANALLLIVVLLLAKRCGVVVNAPGRSVAAIVFKLKEVIHPDLFSQLSQFQALVTQYLISKSDSIQKQLSETLPSLKDAVIATESIASIPTLKESTNQSINNPKAEIQHEEMTSSSSNSSQSKKGNKKKNNKD